MKKDISFGKYYAYWMNNSPKRFLYHLMYYKFAAKLIGKNKKVLDVGCNEGIGTRLLSIECGHASGIDLDLYAIKTAKKNWSDNQTTFNCMNFFDYKGEGWDALTSFDVVEHIQKKNIKKWWACIKKKLKHDGIALIGTPSLSSKKYASKITQKGHINLYSAERLEKEMKRHFAHVFLFAANDEVIHTGFMPLAHYYIALGCQKK